MYYVYKISNSVNKKCYIGVTVGEKHGRSKVSDKQRQEMYQRYLNGETPKSMAKDYGIHWSNVYRGIKFIQKQELGRD